MNPDTNRIDDIRFCNISDISIFNYPRFKLKILSKLDNETIIKV